MTNQPAPIAGTTEKTEEQPPIEGTITAGAYGLSMGGGTAIFCGFAGGVIGHVADTFLGTGGLCREFGALTGAATGGGRAALKMATENARKTLGREFAQAKKLVSGAILGGALVTAFTPHAIQKIEQNLMAKGVLSAPKKSGPAR